MGGQLYAFFYLLLFLFDILLWLFSSIHTPILYKHMFLLLETFDEDHNHLYIYVYIQILYQGSTGRSNQTIRLMFKDTKIRIEPNGPWAADVVTDYT